MDDYDIVIAGAGPAGSAAAIQIANLNPDLARRTLVLEKAVFPRPKLCAGGLTTHADALLAQLNVCVNVPSFPIHAIGFVFNDISFTVPWRNVFRVVRREEFDLALARQAEQRGVEIREGDPLTSISPGKDGVEIQTQSGTLRAKILIGADGANSSVRQKLGLVRADRISRLLEILTPIDALGTPEYTGHTAVFDFTPIASGVQGYYWDFPSLKQGVPTMNRGLFDSRVHRGKPMVNLKPLFAERLAGRHVELASVHLQGHPERWFDAGAKHSSRRIVLAGDAAGTEPLLGEGISHALDFGRMAANAVALALAREKWDFDAYERQIAWSALGRRLRFKRLVAQIVYGNRGDWFYRLGFGLGRLVFGSGR